MKEVLDRPYTEAGADGPKLDAYLVDRPSAPLLLQVHGLAGALLERAGVDFDLTVLTEDAWELEAECVVGVLRERFARNRVSDRR